MTEEYKKELYDFCFRDNNLNSDKFNWIIEFADRAGSGTAKLYDERTRQFNELNHKYENQQKVISDLYERQKSKLMSVYYLLDMLQNYGTHHEKNIVITALKTTIEKLVERDPLRLNEDMLPF